MKNKKGQGGILNNFIVLLIFLIVAFVGGLLAAILYYDLGLIDSTLHTINFPLPIEDNSTIVANGNITDFQGILGVTIYPLLGLRTSLPYLTYFMVFAFIIALAITAYVSSKNPVFFVLHLLFLLLISYFCLILSNTYLQLLAQPFINQLMISFVVYNKVMIYLPSIVFFTGLLFAAIAFVGVMKPQSNQGGNQNSLNYGPDY